MAALLVAVPGQAVAATSRPAFQIPFRCGDRWDAFTRSGHAAIDWNKGTGSDDLGLPVTASAPGIADAKYQSHLGYYVDIDHGGGWVTRYAHLLAADRRSGPVTAGEMIGRVGNSGSSTAPHLHWEQRYNGVQQSPLVANGTTLTADGRTYTSRNCLRRDPFLSGDVDGDGADDLVTRFVYANGTSSVRIIAGSGSRALQQRAALRLTAADMPVTSLLSLGDTNGDGRADLNGAFARNGGVQIVSFYGRTDGTFSTRQNRFYETNWPFSRMHSLRSDDVDGDGTDDLIARFVRTDGSSTVPTVLGAGTRVLTRRRIAIYDAATLPRTAQLTMGDTTGDGRADLNIAYPIRGDTRFASFYGTATGTFADRRVRFSSIWASANLRALRAGDVNGDGIDDLVARFVYRDGSSVIRIVRGKRARALDGVGAVTLSATDLPPAAFVAVGDSNGNGLADLNGALADGGVRYASFYGTRGGTLLERRYRFYGDGWAFHHIC